MKFEASIQFLPGVGPKMAQKLERLGIKTIRDLLFYWPRTWQDFSHPRTISSLRINEDAIIKAKIFSINEVRTRKKWMSLIEVILVDDTGEIKAVWFNQSWLKNTLKVGDEWLVAGKVGWDFKGKCKTLAPSQIENPSADGPLILPIYPETEGLTSKFLRKIIAPLLNQLDQNIEDYLPADIIKLEKLFDLKSAVRQIHFPSDNIGLNKAKERLAFDELFLIALRFLTIKKELQQNVAPSMVIDEKILKDFAQKLPYKLTNAQRKTAWEIILDLAKTVPMNRLLEGDVGSGKTVVATMAALVAIKNNFQVVWLAPTEILANQHFVNVQKLLSNFNIKVGLFTSANKNGDLEKDDLLIGTHALIQKNIQVPRLGLIIIDEQHRFGVKQRSFLRNNGAVKQSNNNLIPHLLSMTATPIPRTLALAIYGDLDISIIDEMPVGRQKIETKIIAPNERAATYGFIRGEIKSGRQVFVVCPLIEAKEGQMINLFDADRKSVMAEYEKLSKDIFPEFKVDLLHGRMKSTEKEEVMKNFKSGKTQILVSTAVIEVGIDIANASVMMIESADRFGLAQLHQFRGRVGRAEHKSYCFLFSDNQSAQTQKRLQAMENCFNGFELAQTDLELRGPGEMVGIRQSGLADLRMANLSDTIMVTRARNSAEKIVSDGLEKYPPLALKLAEFESTRHLE